MKQFLQHLKVLILKRWKVLIVGSFMVGVSLTMGAWVWNDLQPAQTKYYNRGLVAYILGAYDYALKDFDLSYADYKARVGSNLGPVIAPPSLEQAELSQEHKALALVKMKQVAPAIATYKECLLLTSDWYLSHHPLRSDDVEMDKLMDPDTRTDLEKMAAAYHKIKEDGRDCAINLEELFHQQQQQADAEGKGEGQGQGKPKDGDKSSEDPSDAAGKQSRDGVDD